MKKIFSALFFIAFLVACSNENEVLLVPTETFSVKGYSNKHVNTRTYFYEDWLHDDNYDDWPEDGLVFLWNEDDAIWIGGEKSTTTKIEEDESATFGGFSNVPSGKVYYNMAGTTSKEANVLAQQSIENNLGKNGDFGYATLEDGCFTLNHATSYVWFNVVNFITDENDEFIEPDLYLESITLNADGVNIAGKAMWNDENEVFGAITDGQSKITLTVNRDITLDDETLFPMVIFPADLTDKNVKVIYKFKLEGETKYFTQELPGKVLTAGTTQLVFPEIFKESDLTDYMELRVLTFEDADAKFEKYMFYNGYGDEEYIETWSQLIPENQWYEGSPLIYNMGENAEYEWYDANNTELYHIFPLNYGMQNYAGGGAVISSHTVKLEDMGEYTIYNYQVSVTCGGGNNGSENFCVAYNVSEVDPENYGLEKTTLVFGDGEARVIDHMYVTIAAPTHYCITYGNSHSQAFDDDDFLKLVATGIKEDDTETEPIEIMLAERSDYKITDWTKWDLSGLGEVIAVKFHMEEAQKVSYSGENGPYYYKTPLYFAFDDIAVRFEE